MAVLSVMICERGVRRRAVCGPVHYRRFGAVFVCTTVEACVDEQALVVAERGLLSVSDSAWELAVSRAEVIGPLAAVPTVGAVAADAAAGVLGVSRRQVYTWVRRWRQGAGVVSDLLPGRSNGGRGRQHLAAGVESVIGDLIRTQFLTRQKRTQAALYREVLRECRSRGLPTPSRGSVTRRIARVDPIVRVTKREGVDAARGLQSAGGRVPPVRTVLEQVQIDHTPVDLIVVDERARLPIGRPYVTVAIDVFSRCIVGLVLTLDPPSALSVGLCLANMVTDKRAWLDRMNVQVGWPMSGKPERLYLDNAAEFKSEALRRGCAEHGVALRYRPPGQPHYGGIVERVIGTLMAGVHELPGTTFSNPVERGGYDSEGKAALTVRELERWLVLAVASYHGGVHTGVGQTPAARWAQGIAVTGSPPVVTAASAFLVDFLPVIRRTLTRTGFVIDHVGYFSDALKPWIAERGKLDRFVIRRDPRDISRVWVLDPAGTTYLEVPYRTVSHPAVSVWEHRQAADRLREQGRGQVDEDALFRMVGQMRELARTAKKTTRKARREDARRPAANAVAAATSEARQHVPDDAGAAGVAATPFRDIEEW